MKGDDEYQIPWRTNYEAIAVAVWLSGIGGAYLLQGHSRLPAETHHQLMLVCSGMLLMRLPNAIRLWYRKRRLLSIGTTFMPVRDIVRSMQQHPEDIWFGWGFEWGQKHAQLAYEILKRDIRQFIPYRHGLMGATWIHGLETQEQNIYQPISHTAGHTLIVGTTGAGKSRSFDLMITQAVLRGEAVFIIDPKGDKDLKSAAENACLLAGQPERFVFFHPGFPDQSARLNPLKHFSQPSELASRIAQIIPSVNGTDPFKSFGQKSLDNIIQGIVSLNESPTLVELRRYLEGGPAHLVVQALRKHILTTYGDNALDHVLGGKALSTDATATKLIRHYREYVQPEHPNQNLEGLISMFEHDRTHFGKMVASLLPVMNMLTTGDLGLLLSTSRLDERDERPVTHTAGIINNAQVAYIGLDSLSDGMVGSALGSLILADLASVAGKRYNYGVNNRPVNVFVDEAAEVINDPCIQLLNKGRGALIRMVIATQTFADFSARTGSDAKARQILANVNNLIALRVLDSETQKYITDNLPLTRLRYIMRTQGVATQPNNPAFYSGNLGERLMEEQGELFAPQLLGQLPDLHYIAKLSGGRIIKGRIPILKHSAKIESPKGRHNIDLQ